MKRILLVTLVLAGVLFAIFTTRMISQQQLLAWQDARTAEVRQDTQDEAPPPVSVLGEPGGAGAASPPKLPDDAESQISDTAKNPASNTELKALPPSLQVSQEVPDQVARLRPAESLSQLLKKLYPNMSLEVLSVGDAVLLRGDVGSRELQHQIVAISEQFFPKVLAQLQVQPSKLPRADQAEAEAAKPILIGGDKHGLREMFSKLYPTAKLEVNVLTDHAVLIRGRVARQIDIRPVFDIAQQFAPKVLIYVTVDDQQSTLAPVAGSLAGSGGATELVGGVSRLPTTNVTPRDDQDIALDLEAKQMALRVRTAKEPEKSKLRAELEKLTEKHFELRQKRRAAELAELADRVDKLRVAQHRRQENKPDILKRRLADLLDEENELKWDEARLKSTSPVTLPLARPKPDSPLPNLEGEWLVTLPAGFEFVGKIEKRPEGCWSFQEMRNLSGYYQIEGSTLKGVTTDKKEPRDYEWLILSENVMVLTKAPQNIGSDYRGATLRRGVKPKTSSVMSPKAAEDSAPNETATKLTDALVRAAEARRKLAEFEYTRAMELNKKVPGSISSGEIERLKTNLEIANAELDAAKLGADIRRIDKAKERPSTEF